MPFLAIALICWIAAGCFGAGYLANLNKSNEESFAVAFVRLAEDASAINAQRQRLNDVEIVAAYAKDQAKLANKLSETNARSLTDHLEQVYAWRAAKEKAALQPSKPRRRAHDRDR